MTFGVFRIRNKLTTATQYLVDNAVKKLAKQERENANAGLTIKRKKITLRRAIAVDRRAILRGRGVAAFLRDSIP